MPRHSRKKITARQHHRRHAVQSHFQQRVCNSQRSEQTVILASTHALVRSITMRPCGWNLVGFSTANSYAHQCEVTSYIPPYPSSYLSLRFKSQRIDRIYATLANQGIWVKQHIVVKLKDDKDRVTLPVPSRKAAVYSVASGEAVTGMLENAARILARARLSARSMASPLLCRNGKTGTTTITRILFEGFTSKPRCRKPEDMTKPRQVMAGGYAQRGPSRLAT